MTMSKNPTFLVTYTGEGVVSLARVGLFQTGTMAVVGAEAAAAARAQGHFQVRPFGEPGERGALPPPAPPAPPLKAVDISPPPPVIAEPPAPIAEPPAPIAEPPAGESMSDPPAPPAEEPLAAAAMGGEPTAPEAAGDSHDTHETHEDGDAAAPPEETSGESTPPRRKPRRH
jgi:hypothetical protein